jgi:hypothetical protein
MAFSGKVCNTASDGKLMHHRDYFKWRHCLFNGSLV